MPAVAHGHTMPRASWAQLCVGGHSYSVMEMCLPPQSQELPVLATLAPPIRLLPTNLCSCLVLNFPARCLVVNGVSFGSTPAGDRGTPSSAPPVPAPPRPLTLGLKRGTGWTKDKVHVPAACRLPGGPISPCPPGQLLTDLGHGSGTLSVRTDT